MSTLNKPPDHYGLSLILGGSEGTLWDITNIYSSMARTLKNYHSRPKGKRYSREDYHFANYGLGNHPSNSEEERNILTNGGPLNAASIWFTFEAMQEVFRPVEDASWKLFSSANKIAWKTGTSFGHRDAWSIGLTPDYVVGVWTGNADGEGRPDLTGISAAAPIMFDIFDKLPKSGWFNPPMDELELAAVDAQSGYLASPFSINIDTALIPKVGVKTGISPYHRPIHLGSKGKYRVDSDCESVNNMQSTNWFVLPPRQATYFKKKNPTYQELPPLRSDCDQTTVQNKNDGDCLPSYQCGNPATNQFGWGVGGGRI